VYPAKNRLRNNVSEPLNRACAGCVLAKRKVRPRLIIVAGRSRRPQATLRRLLSRYERHQQGYSRREGLRALRRRLEEGPLERVRHGDIFISIKPGSYRSFWAELNALVVDLYIGNRECPTRRAASASAQVLKIRAASCAGTGPNSLNNLKTGDCFPAQGRIAIEAGFGEGLETGETGRRAVQRAVSKAARLGWLKREFRRGKEPNEPARANAAAIDPGRFIQ
jgi:hypothetical protein